MTNRKIQIGASSLIVIIILFLAINLWPEPKINLPPELAVDFTNGLSRGTIMGDGTFLLYSLGEKLDPLTLNLSAEVDTHYVEFEAVTKDRRVVYVKYFLLGNITNKEMLNAIFTKDGEERGIILYYLPTYFRSELTRLVAEHNFAEFSADQESARVLIEQELSKGIDPVFKDLGYEPKIPIYDVIFLQICGLRLAFY